MMSSSNRSRSVVLSLLQILAFFFPSATGFSLHQQNLVSTSEQWAHANNLPLIRIRRPSRPSFIPHATISPVGGGPLSQEDEVDYLNDDEYDVDDEYDDDDEENFEGFDDLSYNVLQQQFDKSPLQRQLAHNQEAATKAMLQAVRRRKRPKKVPLIAIVGRPNVGKSALVNRIAGTQSGGAIVADVAGITRDRTYRDAEFVGERFQIVDTGGIVFDDNDQLFASEIRQQAMIAIEEASGVIFVVDGKVGMTALDQQVSWRVSFSHVLVCNVAR